MAEAEDLFKTRYHNYVHASGQSQIACEEYSIPAHLQGKHIDLVWPTVHFDTKLVKKSNDVLSKRSRSSLGQPGSGSLPKLKQWLGGIGNVIKELTQCDTQITPWCLRVCGEIDASRIILTIAGSLWFPTKPDSQNKPQEQLWNCRVHTSGLPPRGS